MNTAPIRYSVDEDIRRPATKQIGHLLDITINGVPVKRCVRYDIEAGEIERTVIDRRGNPLIDYENGECRTQIVRGHVEVTLRTDG